MRHPAEGVLRRLLDEPAGVADPDRDHAAGCDRCRAGLATIDEDRARVDAALVVELADLDLDAAWLRLSTSSAAAAAAGTDVPGPAGVTPIHATRPRSRRRRFVAGVASTAVLAGASAAAASGWLPIFRTEQVAPVAVSIEDLNAVPDLAAFGDYEVTGDPDLRDVPDAAAAEAATGLDAPEVADLPRGIEGEPTYRVGDGVTATFTFSADSAARAAADAGEPLPPVPPELDDARVRLVGGPALAAVWDGTTGPPALIVGRAVAPSAFSDGASFATLRDYLTSFPGVPDDLAVQLRAFDTEGSTLPLPVPEDRLGSTSSAQVDGVEATVLTTKDQTLAAVVWVEDGIVTAVAGTLDADEVLAVARGLR